MDWKKFDLGTIPAPQVKLANLKVTVREGLNVRSGAAATNAKIGKLNFGEAVVPLEKSSGWVKIKYGDGFGWVSESYLA